MEMNERKKTKEREHKHRQVHKCREKEIRQNTKPTVTQRHTFGQKKRQVIKKKDIIEIGQQYLSNINKNKTGSEK